MRSVGEKKELSQKGNRRATGCPGTENAPGAPGGLRPVALRPRIAGSKPRIAGSKPRIAGSKPRIAGNPRIAREAMCGGSDSNFLPYEPGDTVRCAEAAGAAARIGKVEAQHVDLGIAVIWEDGTRTWYPYERWVEDWSKTGFRFEAADDSLYRPRRGFMLEPLPIRHWEPAELGGPLGTGWMCNPPKRRNIGATIHGEDFVCELATTEPEPMDCGPCVTTDRIQCPAHEQQATAAVEQTTPALLDATAAAGGAASCEAVVVH